MCGSIYLVRHGETYWNKNKIMHGQYDIPLDDVGIKQAKNLSHQLRDVQFDVCYCSPLERAKKTAVEILKYHRATPVIYDDRLKEINKGLLEGTRSISESILFKEDYNVLEKYNVESKIQFFTRVSELMKEIQSKYKDKNVLIVSHSGTVKMAMFYLNPPNKPIYKAYYDLHIKNCSYQKLPNIKPSINALDLYCNKQNTVNKSCIINCRDKGDNSMKIGIYPMVADVLHTGHIVAIEEAKKHCDYLIIALHCCPNYKTPVQTIYERFMQLRAVKWVDEVIPYTDVNDAKNMLLSLDYDVYFLGEDHDGKDWECNDVVKSTGKEVVYLSRKHPFSSTYLKDRVVDSYNNNKEGK